MIQVKREAPKCKKCGKILEWLPWQSGKPRPPVDPATKAPCDCWKTKGKGGDYSDPFNKPRWLKKEDLAQCTYCSGSYEKVLGNEDHEAVYHKDKKVHAGEYVIGLECFTDEVLYKGSGEHWYLRHPDKNGDFLSVDGVDNIRDFAEKHGVKHIMDSYTLQ